MTTKNNSANETTSKELLKLLFFFNRFVREPFSTNEDGQTILSSYKNIVGKNNVVIKAFTDSDPRTKQPDIQNNIENYNGKPHKLTSDTVSYNKENKEFIANTYGFIIFKNNKLQVLPLLSISPDKIEAHLFIANKIDNSMPSLEEIKEVISSNNLIHPIQDKIINEQINKSQNGKNIIIAKGIKPIDGYLEYFELSKKEKNEIGTKLENGKIDYKEKDSFLLVKKNEIIARKIETIEPQDGYDVFGNSIKAITKEKNEYSIGNNISPHPNNLNIYIADIDGGINIETDGTISVEERIIIENDVNIETGNIHFDGFVEIKGNITKGFTVDAGKDLIVKENIEDATVNVNGSIYVQNGIIGEKTNIHAKKNIFAKFIQSASITAEQNINVVDSIVQGNCLAKEYINVEGKVVGGKIHGYLGVNIGSAGSLAGTKTTLATGIDNPHNTKISPNIEEKLQKIKILTEEITSCYGQNIYKNINHIINSLPDYRKKHLINTIRQIKTLQLYVKQEKIKENEMKNHQKESNKESKIPNISINNKIYPGTIIKINHIAKKIEKASNLKTTFTENSINKENNTTE